MSTESALTTLFGSAGASQFSGDTWPERPVVGHGPLARLPAEFASGALCSVDALSEVYQGSISIHRNYGRKQTGVGVQGGTPRDFFALGLSMVLEDVRDSVPGVHDWLSALESEVGMPPGHTKLVGFAGRKGEGVLPHWDSKEGILIQVQGRKRIRLSPNADVQFPTTSHISGSAISEELAVQIPGAAPRWPEDSEEVVELDPGSVIFIPRGYWHTTETLDDSLAIAVDFTLPTMAEMLLPHLNLHLLQSVAWRSAPKGAWNDVRSFERGVAQLDRLLTDLQERLASVRAEDVLASVNDMDTRFQFLPEDALFVRQDVELSASANDDGTTDLRLASAGDYYAETTIGVPNAYVPTFEWILARDAKFSLADVGRVFPKLAMTKIREILKMLIASDGVQFAGSPSNAVASGARESRPSARAM